MRKIIFLFFLSFCVFVRGVREDEGDLKLGEECESHEDCEHIANAVCDNYDICECMEGYLASSNNSTCLPLATKIGDKCEITEQCSNITAAECLNKTCVIAQVVTTMPSVAKPKEECTTDSQCSSILIKRVCKNGTCVLELPLDTPKNVGFDAFVFGKPCFNDSECATEGGACIDKLCKCVENFVLSQNLKKCLPKAKSVGDKCVETAQCIELNGSVCENEKCSQKISRFFNIVNEKIPPLLIGSTCQTDNECKHLTHALCLENVCQCKENYITSIASNSCLEKAKKEGDPCEIDKQCENIKGATCIQNKCVKPGVVGTKLGKQNSGSTKTVSKFILAAILLKKVLFV